MSTACKFCANRVHCTKKLVITSWIEHVYTWQNIFTFLIHKCMAIFFEMTSKPFSRLATKMCWDIGLHSFLKLRENVLKTLHSPWIKWFSTFVSRFFRDLSLLSLQGRREGYKENDHRWPLLASSRSNLSDSLQRKDWCVRISELSSVIS